MARGFNFFTGALLGAGILYLMDPDRGERRRALVRDKFVRFGNDARWYANKQMRNANNHVRGTVAEYYSRWRDSRGEVSDEVLEERVRAQIGHVVSHPGSLDVVATGGHVTIAGPVLRGESEKLRERLDVTRGVRDYDLRVEEHDSAENVPGLQGESRFQRKERAGGIEPLERLTEDIA
jgi:hypothetical protein